MQASPSQHRRLRLARVRPLLWRYRFLVSGLCLAWAVVLIVPLFAPPPPAPTVLVASHHLAAGTVLSASDLRAVAMPSPPEQAFTEQSLIGERLAVAVPENATFIPSMIVAEGLTDSAPSGTVVLPVRLADPAMIQLLRIGDSIDLYRPVAAGDSLSGESELVSRSALVLSLLEDSPSGSGLLDIGKSGAPTAIVVAVPREDANVLTGTQGVSTFRAVVVPH